MLVNRVVLECDLKVKPGTCEGTFTGSHLVNVPDIKNAEREVTLTRFEADNKAAWLFIPALISLDGKSKDICSECAKYQNELSKLLIAKNAD